MPSAAATAAPEVTRRACACGRPDCPACRNADWCRARGSEFRHVGLGDNDRAGAAQGRTTARRPRRLPPRPAPGAGALTSPATSNRSFMLRWRRSEPTPCRLRRAHRRRRRHSTRLPPSNAKASARALTCRIGDASKCCFETAAAAGHCPNPPLSINKARDLFDAFARAQVGEHERPLRRASSWHRAPSLRARRRRKARDRSC